MEYIKDKMNKTLKVIKQANLANRKTQKKLTKENMIKDNKNQSLILTINKTVKRKKP